MATKRPKCEYVAYDGALSISSTDIGALGEFKSHVFNVLSGPVVIQWYRYIGDHAIDEMCPACAFILHGGALGFY